MNADIALCVHKPPDRSRDVPGRLIGTLPPLSSLTCYRPDGSVSWSLAPPLMNNGNETAGRAIVQSIHGGLGGHAEWSSRGPNAAQGSAPQIRFGGRKGPLTWTFSVVAPTGFEPVLPP